MASTKEYRDFIMEQLKIIGDITYKPMMGEYLLYYEGLLFGGIYDDRLLVKITETNKKYHMEKAIPYETAKEMYLVEDVDSIDTLIDIINDTCEGLKKD